MPAAKTRDPLLTPGQVAEALEIPRRAVVSLIRGGELRAVPGRGNPVRIRRSDLLKYAQALVDARRSGRRGRAGPLPELLCLNSAGRCWKRTFDGWPYIAASAWKTQESAQAEAHRLRCAGQLARVTQELAPLRSWPLRRPPKPSERTFWAVWESEG